MKSMRVEEINTLFSIKRPNTNRNLKRRKISTVRWTWHVLWKSFYGVRARFRDDLQTNRSIKKLLLFLILFLNCSCSIKRYKYHKYAGKRAWKIHSSRKVYECESNISHHFLSPYSTSLTAILIHYRVSTLFHGVWTLFHFLFLNS